ncbi:MAG: thiol oxidoreductase, partial [Rhodospirillaceae bacterium]|nr:thiol oxidoreductase [Rhodospirillaceae bacterium]
LLAALAAPAAAEAPRLGAKLGGDTSRPVAGLDSFALPAANLPQDRLARFFEGQRLFNIAFVKAPSPVPGLAGLGPTFNRPSCGACHTKDGRGQPPSGPADALMQMVVRLGAVAPGPSPFGRPHPAYGKQLNDRGIEGVPAEGRAAVAWDEVEGHYADGEAYRLRRPRIALEGLAFGPLDPAALSPRIAPQLVGMGLLEAVPAAELRRRAEANRAHADGVRGQLRVVDARGTPGRFGWRAEQPSVRAQIASALLEDMGLTTSLHPAKNCPPPQSACRAADPGPRPNVADAELDTITFYVSSLAVPERRDAEAPAVRRGEKVFAAIGCDACHRPTLRTGAHALPHLAHQTIHPFTDLLLHDLGEGLADGLYEGALPGRFWRTAPLWGIGVVPIASGHENYLHDGRARGLAEAILWHGGEAALAKDRFRSLPKPDRDALIAFLRSL